MMRLPVLLLLTALAHAAPTFSSSGTVTMPWSDFEGLYRKFVQVDQPVPTAPRDYTLDRAVYDALAALDVSKADADTRYYVTRTLRDFRLAGVDKGVEKMERGLVYDIPEAQDQDLATLKLATVGVSIDELTEEQKAYSLDYAAGT